jgi:LuxR family maltose regulon positive regulatory protein
MVWLGAEARLALAQGQPTKARGFLEQAWRQRDPRMRAPGLDRWLLLAESEVDLMTGVPERVEARYAGSARGDGPSMPEQVIRARAAFALRDLERAENLLAWTATSMSETVATVEAQILTALIADARGHGMQAVDGLAGALALAEREGIRRPFIAMGGDRLASLLDRQNLLADGSMPFGADILNAMKATVRRSRPSYPAGSLSEREVEVLHYLPTMLTAGEIATELGVSVNTVKAHMRSIYRKLEAARRREAVTRAYDCGLL